MPIAILAMFVDVKWSQIKHPVAISNADMLSRFKKKTNTRMTEQEQG